MKEKGIAIVVCVVMIAVVVYAGVFLTSRAQQIHREQQTLTMQLAAEVAKQEEERWQVQTAEADKYYDLKCALQKQKQKRLRQQQLRPQQKYVSTKEQWMNYALQTGVFSNINRMNHEVAMDPSMWQVQSIDSKWQMMEHVHLYFDGYATIVSSASGHPLASYNAWGGIKIHD